MKHIVLTGGGTAGHVTPNIALIPTLKAAGYQQKCRFRCKGTYSYKNFAEVLQI